MTKHAILIAALCTALLLAACAGKPLSPVMGSYTPAPSPDSNHALVYVHYSYQEVAQYFGTTVFFNDQEIATLASGSYTRVYVEPGRYTIKSHWCSKWENGYCPGDLLADFDFSATRSYFININFTGRVTSGIRLMGYTPVPTSGYEDISVSYDIQDDDNNYSYAKQAKPNKEFVTVIK